MTTLQALIIAIVEGLTEFLPVSSTGHMMIAEGLLGVEMTDFVKAFTVIIQFGAILSVVVLYWRRFFNPPTDREGGTWWSRIWPFYLKLVVGVLPAVVVGVTLKKIIDQNLESVQMVAVMLVVGGVFMLFCDRLFNHTSDETPLTYRRAFGWYRIAVGLLILLLPFCGVSLKTEHEHEQPAPQTASNSTTFAQNSPTSAS